MSMIFRASPDEWTPPPRHSQSAATIATRCTTMKRTVKNVVRASNTLIALALTVSVISNTAHAQTLCGERSEILEVLEQKHKESVQAIGIAQDGGFVEVLVSPTGGWTILVTYPQRSTCVVTTGRDWSSRLRKVDPSA